MKNFFNTKTNWTIRELSLLKVYLLSIGLCLGIYFSQQLGPFLFLLALVAGITTLAVIFLWILKPKTHPRK